MRSSWSGSIGTGRSRLRAQRGLSSRGEAALLRTLNDIRLARSGHLRLPDFLCIGAQKSGTSWLYARLSELPSVAMPEIKELHYFDRGANRRRSLRWYASHFEQAGDALTGDITPAYATLRGPRLKHLWACLPDVRVIFLARHPVERVWSALRMYAAEAGHEHPGAFSDAWIRERIREPRVRLRTAYRETMGLWESRYGADRVLCEPYDAIGSDPAALLRRVAGFLSVDPSGVEPETVRERVFAGQAGAAPAWLEDELFELYADEIDWGIERFGDRIGDWTTRGRITDG